MLKWDGGKEVRYQEPLTFPDVRSFNLAAPSLRHWSRKYFTGIWAVDRSWETGLVPGKTP